MMIISYHLRCCFPLLFFQHQQQLNEVRIFDSLNSQIQNFLFQNIFLFKFLQIYQFGGYYRDLIFLFWFNQMFEVQNQNIQLFRTITSDYTINDNQIVKFLKWGNNDVQSALNYYFQKIDKTNNSKLKNQPKLSFKSSLKPQKVELKTQKLEQKCQKVQKDRQKVQQKRQNILSIKEVQCFEQQKVQEQIYSKASVFDKMKKASIKQKQTQQFIQKVRLQYQLPINGKKQSNNKLKQNHQQHYDVQEEFRIADYLPKVFDNHMEIQEDNEFQDDEQINTQLKAKLKQLQVQNNIVNQVQKKKKSHTQNVQKIVYQRPNTRNQGKSKPQPRFQMYESQQQQISYQKPVIKPSAPIFDLQKSQKSQTKQKSFQQITPIIMPSQLYIGEYFFSGFKTDTKPFPDQLHSGCSMQYKYYIQPQKSKKGIKSSKSTQKLINMRILFQNIQICRVEDHQARIFVPLITQNIIKIQVALFQLPFIINTFSKVKLIAKVFLKKKALTQPVVQTFDGQTQEIVNIYKGIRQELSGLLERLNLQVNTYPLIKNKSKFALKAAKDKRSITRQIQFERKAIQFQKKQQQYNIRKQNDPFFKIKQTNIAQMMKKQSQSTPPSQKQSLNNQTPIKNPLNLLNPSNPSNLSHPLQSPSQIKKKIIQLNTIEENKYAQLIDLYQQDIQPIYPKHNFNTQLYHYQAIALAWMLKREGKTLVQSNEIKQQQQEIHPLWTEYQLPEQKTQFKSLYFNQLTAQTSLIKPVTKTKCKGGILADEMGLGKTVMMAALISSGLQKSTKKNEAQNLVVVPLTLLSQWQSQIKKHTKNVSVALYYTSQRNKISEDLANYNVVITTYGTLSHQFTKLTKLSKVGLYKYKWKRIILDQAHYIKGRVIQTSKAVYTLQGDCRWCLTGTPIQNGLNDLFSLIHFIKYAPWAEFQCWSKYIIKPHEMNDQNVYDVLRTLLKRVFLRRTKQSKDQNGKNIIQLPKKISKIQILEMNPNERQFYDMIYQSSKKKIDQLNDMGLITAKYMQVLQILMKLRQVCCHPVLFKSITKFIKNPQSFQGQLRKFIKKRTQFHKSLQDSSQHYFQPLMQGDQQLRIQISQQTTLISQQYLLQTLQKITSQTLQNCLICMDSPQSPIITSCLHIFCKSCIIRQIQQSGKCAICRKLLTKDDLLHLPRDNRFGVDLHAKDFVSSTKMIALIQHLQIMQNHDKAVVFSQFLGMMDLIEHDLRRNHIRFVRMEGSTPQKQRAKIISEFQNNPQVKIFLVSLKTAGVGLNLVAANKVFLMDPWWNPGVEDQAIERVHRIGQKKEVEVIRFIMDKTIQMRMVQLNTQKKNLSQMVLSVKDNDGDSKFDKLRYLMEKY